MSYEKSTVGLDLSLTSTGWATSDGTGTVQSKLKGMERLDEISKEVQNLISDIPSPIVAVEGYAFAKRSSHAHAQGELGGIVRLQLHRARIPFVEIPPTNRAKFITGRGNANKSEVVSHVSAKTGIVWSGSGADDECDAWALRQMLLSHLQGDDYEMRESFDLSALVKIDWGIVDQSIVRLSA